MAMVNTVGPMLAALTLGALPAAAAPTAQAAPAPSAMEQAERDLDVRDFAFQGGERLHHKALGTPRRNAAGKIVNAVLPLRATVFHAAAWARQTRPFLVAMPGQEASR